MDLEDALDLIEYAYHQREEELLYQRWIHDIQFQMSFDEFKQKLKPPVLKPDEEILSEVRDILAQFEGR